MKTKRSTVLVFVLVIVYLAAITWLAFADKKLEPFEEPAQYQNPTIAPDGTVLRGPTAPPPGNNPPSIIDPSTGSIGPGYAPPTQ